MHHNVKAVRQKPVHHPWVYSLMQALQIDFINTPKMVLLSCDFLDGLKLIYATQKTTKHQLTLFLGLECHHPPTVIKEAILLAKLLRMYLELST